jgi:hypothetical protein
MNHSITACDSLIESETAYDVSENELDAVTFAPHELRRNSHQRAHAVAIGQKAFEQMASDEAGGAGEKDLHEGIVEAFVILILVFDFSGQLSYALR